MKKTTKVSLQLIKGIAEYYVKGLKFVLFVFFIVNNANAQRQSIANDLIQKNSPLKGFVENKGQICDQAGNPNPSVLYLLSRPGINIQLRKNGFSYDTYTAEKKERNVSKHKIKSLPDELQEPEYHLTYKMHRVDIELANSNTQVQLQPQEALSGCFNYYNGTSEQAETNVHHYKTITYKNIYPNIDLVFTLKNDKAEYDFVVHPGGNPKDIQMDYKGMDDMQQTQKTELSLKVTSGTFTDNIPLSYELENHKKIEVAYNVSNNNKIGFTISGYDKNNTLVIDPATSLSWATYLGGAGVDLVYALSLDKNNNIIVSGYTQSTSGLATAGAYQTIYEGGNDGFIAKFSTNGTLQWATYFGGTGADASYGLAIDANNNIYSAGYTTSSTGIATPGSYMTAYGGAGNYEAYLAKFSSSGALQWGTYYGGNGGDYGYGVAIDGNSNLLITGYTSSSSGIATPGVYQTNYNGNGDAFIAKFSPDGTTLLWGTYYYGNSGYVEGEAITTDLSNNVFITGFTTSCYSGVTPGVSTLGAYQSTNGGGCGSTSDIFIAKFTTNGSIVWGTYYGGTGNEAAYTITVDGSGDVLLGGRAGSPGMATAGAYQTAMGGGIYDAILAKFNPSGTMQWATYFGGTVTDYGYAITTDGNSKVYLGGESNSTTGIATPYAYQTVDGGGFDAYLARFNLTNGSLNWATYYGGTGLDIMRGLALDTNKNILAAGYTTSSAGIATAGSYQTLFGGGDDAFIAKFNDPCNLKISSITICNGNNPNLINLLGNINDNYTWMPSASLSSSVGYNIIASPTVTTTYTVTESSCGNSASFTINVIAAALPTIVVASNAYACIGRSTTISATGALNYLWYPSTGLSSNTGSNVTASPLIATNYTVTGTDINGCANLNNASITVTPVPNPAVDLLLPYVSICPRTSTTLSVYSSTSAPPVKFLWSPNIYISADTGSSIIASPDTTMIYSVTGTDGNGCSATSKGKIVINPLPSLNLSNVTIASGNSVMLLGTPQLQSYLWQPATGLSCYLCSNPIADPVNTTAYSVTVTNAFGCDTSGTITVYVVSTVGIKEQLLDNLISLYPNPNTGMFTLSIARELQFLEINIIDVTGKLIYNQKINNRGNNNYVQDINLSEFSKGIYILKANTDKEAMFKKIIIE